MNKLAGYDVVIVCCSNQSQEDYWQRRLESVRGQVMPLSTVVVAVHEDWPGGAGNGLGTLYAYQKAVAKASASNVDLNGLLKDGKSVAMFHTAGKGTRLAPLPGAENNNKPGVKLPVPGSVSILESVIRQTGAYATSRKSRLSVFWGDQIFIPSLPAEYEPKHHADILCALGPVPNAEEWKAKGLQSYGLIATDAENKVLAQLEKVTHEVATEGLKSFPVDRVGASLGSFSLSAPLLSALVAGFQSELNAKTGS